MLRLFQVVIVLTGNFTKTKTPMNNHQLAVLLVFSVTSLSAQNFKPRSLVPISGHYKNLAQADAQPRPNSPIDRRHFPLDSLPVSYAKRLKLTPEYLTLRP